MNILKNYDRCCREHSDISEHIPTLYRYAAECNHVTECGVRTVVSSYAFAAAMLGRPDTKLVQVDPQLHINILAFGKHCDAEGVRVVFHNQSDLTCPLEQTDLLFIDTWHVYGQLKRELARWNGNVNKYIILHDTTVDEWYGETYRCGWDPVKQSAESGIPVEEITKGLWPAVDEFLKEHPEWTLHERYTNNNGLTVLTRTSSNAVDE